MKLKSAANLVLPASRLSPVLNNNSNNNSNNNNNLPCNGWGVWRSIRFLCTWCSRKPGIHVLQCAALHTRVKGANPNPDSKTHTKTDKPRFGSLSICIFGQFESRNVLEPGSWKRRGKRRQKHERYALTVHATLAEFGRKLPDAHTYVYVAERNYPLNRTGSSWRA